MGQSKQIPKIKFNMFGSCRAKRYYENYKRLKFDNDKFKKTLQLEDIAVFENILKSL